MLRILSALLLCASSSLCLQAGNYVGGDIRFISEEGSTVVDFEVYMYSFFSGLDSEALELCLSNGECLTLSQTTAVEQGRYDLYRYRYDISYDFEAFGFYRAWLTYTKLSDGICNVNFPNSGSIPFYTELQFELMEDRANASPMFEEPPYLTGEVGQLCTYHPIPIDNTPNWFINYDHIVPRMGVDMPVPNYVYPNDISPGVNNALNVDHWFGLMTWEAPQEACRYMLTYRVTELLTQNDIKASVIRNILIDVYDSGNQIPEIIVDTTEVYLPYLYGVYTKEIAATDADQDVLLEGYGSFLADPLATFTAPVEFSADTTIGTIAITGETALCSSVASPCKLILRATDNFSSTNPGTRFQYFTFAYGPQLNSSEPESSPNILALAPNPTSGWVEVRLPPNSERGTLEVYSPLGQRMEQRLIPVGEDIVQLDAESWPPGMYWIVWKEGQNAWGASLVKQ